MTTFQRSMERRSPFCSTTWQSTISVWWARRWWYVFVQHISFWSPFLVFLLKKKKKIVLWNPTLKYKAIWCHRSYIMFSCSRTEVGCKARELNIDINNIYLFFTFLIAKKKKLWFSFPLKFLLLRDPSLTIIKLSDKVGYFYMYCQSSLMGIQNITPWILSLWKAVFKHGKFTF